VAAGLDREGLAARRFFSEVSGHGRSRRNTCDAEAAERRVKGRGAKPGRNDPCPCGSGLKYKACCAAKDEQAAAAQALGRARFRQAIALERSGRTDEAIAAYARLTHDEATAADAQSRLGHILLSRGRAKEAANALRAAAAAAPDDPARRLDLVRALTVEKQDAEAEAEVRAVLEIAPANSEAWWLLGRILSETGRFDLARAALERAEALNPGQGVVLYDLVRSYRLTEADRPLVRRMLARARAPADTDQRIRLHLALGKAFDDLGDYGAAMAQFGLANRAKQEMVNFDRAGFVRRIDALIERFSPDYLARHGADGDPSRLPVMVVGMPRSGTTLVEQILSSHPAIEGAGELQFWAGRGAAFDQIRPGAPLRDFQRQAARDALQTLGGLAPGAARVVDKAPFNFLWAGLIHLVFPNAVIVHCRRNALDTCLSISSTYFAARPDFPTFGADLVAYYRQYLRLMDHWRAVLPADRFVEVDYETLVADPERQTRRLVAACGVAWDPACLHPELNTRVVRTPSKWQARQPIGAGSVGRWRRYQPWLGNLGELADNQ
jgi:Flp pilus assembly protein TadD